MWCQRVKTANTPSMTSSEIEVRNLYLASAANIYYHEEFSSFGVKSKNKLLTLLNVERSTNLRICKADRHASFIFTCYITSEPGK